VSARRITGRTLLLDGPGAIAEVPTDALRDVLLRLHRGMSALGWSVEPVWRHHRAGSSIGLRSPPDQVRATADLLDWAIDGGDDDDLDDVRWRARRDDNPRLRALFQAFPGLVFEGEDLVTVGLGRFARSFSRDALPPPAALHPVRGIPRVCVTGTNGKTTTTRLLAHLATAAGHLAGRTSSDAVVIGEETVERGDWTGPGATRRVLRDPRVTFAALETARGGVLRRGLAVDGADVAVLTNVTPDHGGEWGIDDLTVMARAKFVVADGLRRGGTLVVPAVSGPIHTVLPSFRKRRPDVVVQTFASTPRPADCWADDGHLHVGDGRVPLSEIPLTFGGTARHNVENVQCAVLAGLAAGIPAGAISRGLRTFRPSVADNPGRMNTYRLPNGALAVIDFAHNEDGVKRIVDTVRRWPRARRTLLIGQAGDRTDAEIARMGAAAAPLQPHRVVLKEVGKRLYGRSEGEVPALMRQGLIAGGVSPARIEGPTADEALGVRAAVAGASPDDVIVLLLHETLAAAVGILEEHGAVSVDDPR